MSNLIKLYKQPSIKETTTTSKHEISKPVFDLEKYPRMEMKAKKTRYKLVLD